jgi:RNA polymerase sigma factor (sigma-70 family)
MLYAKRISKDEEFIEDCIHDLFVNIWKSREGLADLDNIRPYLMVSLRHKLVKELKKKSKVELKEIEDGFLEKELSAEERIIGDEFDAELKGQLNESLKLLSGRQREAIYLRYNESMEYDDICAAMNINYQSVRNLISTGIKKLSSDFNKEKQ